VPVQDADGSIARFLVDLADDPALLERYRSSTEGANAAMDEYKLSEGQKDVVRSGNLAKIREALDYEYRAGRSNALPPYEPAVGEYDATEAADSHSGGGKHMVVTWRVPRPTW
jgi:hypothetical protein